ncbi:hypothetical protein BH18ACT17_BH18ACT17_06800 [soil metagenome]
MNLDGHSIVDADTMLRVTDRTLGDVIEHALGTAPELKVVSQSVADPPHPGWAVPPLGAGSRLLVRRTSYRFGALTLSRNLACVDLDRVPAPIAADLSAERLNLGELFRSDAIRKSAFRFEVPGQVDRSLHEGYPDDGPAFDPCVSRRYEATFDDRISFVVVESLPRTAWSALLGSSADRDRMMASAHPGAA